MKFIFLTILFVQIFSMNIWCSEVFYSDNELRSKFSKLCKDEIVPEIITRNFDILETQEYKNEIRSYEKDINIFLNNIKNYTDTDSRKGTDLSNLSHLLGYKLNNYPLALKYAELADKCKSWCGTCREGRCDKIIMFNIHLGNVQKARDEINKLPERDKKNKFQILDYKIKRLSLLEKYSKRENIPENFLIMILCYDSLSENLLKLVKLKEFAKKYKEHLKVLNGDIQYEIACTYRDIENYNQARIEYVILEKNYLQNVYVKNNKIKEILNDLEGKIKK